MKRFNIVFATIVSLLIILFVTTNIFLISANNNSSKEYKVEISRASIIIEEKGLDKVNISDYRLLIDIIEVTNNDDYTSDTMYEIKIINGKMYRFDYKVDVEYNNIIFIINISLGIVSVIVIGMMLYIKYRILKPFNILSNLPLELSKGNLSANIKEHSSKYFGKFTWGLDLLREKLEEQRKKELEFQKEKKTNVMTLSHDIKTPLSVIELYAKALQKNLYKDEAKQKEATFNIIRQCEEINKYVSKITAASSEDIVNLDIELGEHYLSEIVNTVTDFYKDKLDFLKIDFYIEKFSNCILCCDIDRSIEVLQNIFENAIKYGDGKYISFSFEQEDGYMLLTVKNSGCTLPQNELIHIFNSFWRGSNIGSNSGSGLGLYICRQLMMKMNGDIFAKIIDGCMCVTVVIPML